VRSRIDRYWRPYHDELAAVLDARHRDHGCVWYIDCHSMPAVGDDLADDRGALRADFVLGDRDGTTCELAFTALVADAAREMGYTVAINNPYKGVELVRKHGNPAANRHGLQVELKRTLYMDETSLLPNAGFAKLEADLTRLLGVVAEYVRRRTSRN
jgi:N-formylglutamate amidohydrolase